MLRQKAEIGLAGRKTERENAKARCANVPDGRVGRETRRVRRLFQVWPVSAAEGDRHAPEPPPRRKGSLLPVMFGQP